MIIMKMGAYFQSGSFKLPGTKNWAFWFFFLLLEGNNAYPQSYTSFDPFQVICLNPATPVKNQYKTNTCWCFSVVSFLESELLRKMHDTIDLSEMYFVRYVYEKKAEKFYRMHGTISLSGGGVLNDVMDAIPFCGMVPEQVYPAIRSGGLLQDHIQLDNLVKSFMEKTILQPETGWEIALRKILDDWLGEVPETFYWKGKLFTPQTFRDSLGIDPSRYLVLTSFLHHPWYSSFPVEVPDNWNWAAAWNLPLDELEHSVRYALCNGYTVAWAADISEPGFLWRDGLAYLSNDTGKTALDEKAGAWKINEPGMPVPSQEPVVNQSLRQMEFDRYATTDDHAMHIVGLSVDTTGKKWYIAKNSWGTQGTRFNGYILISEQYFRAKTLTVLLPWEALPKEIQNKISSTK